MNSRKNQMNMEFGQAMKHRILIDYERAKLFKKGILPRPRFAVLYVSNSCVQNCQYCEYAEENKGGLMKVEDVYKTIDQLANLGVSAIELTGGGEPLVHPNIIEILKYCKTKDMAVGVISNLAVKNQELMKVIVGACSYIRVTVDSFDPRKYNEIRRPKTKDAGLERVKENLKTLVALKEETGSFIIIGVKMVISRLNSDSIEDFIKGAIGLGVDNAQFKRVYVRENLKINDDDFWGKIKQKLEGLKEKYKNEIDIFHGFFGVDDLKLKPGTKCFMHINHIFIDRYGDVYLCCHYLMRKESLKLGNIYKKPLEKIWFGKKHWEAIKNINNKDCNEADCRWVKYTNFMKPLLDDETRQFDFI